MYLKKIELSGFKSFPDKININLNSGVTAIVGPNGSGKSNVVDAIKWALGEASLKTLRASVKEDVIFKGSKTRKEMKRAHVSLLFDNSDKFLKTEFSEVEIKREIFKTGESFFYINGVKCRLKDVQNLFIDKGINNKSFNIISQGNISDIVLAKPFDRRGVIESAAGILQYKNRKLEAIRKLEKTKTNLGSVTLVTNELKKSMAPLKRQSKNAIKYEDLKKEANDLELSLLVYKIKTLNDEVVFLEKENKDLSQKIKSESISFKELKDLEEEKLYSEKKLKELRDKHFEVQKELMEKNVELSSYEEKLKYSKNITLTSGELLQKKEEQIKVTNKINQTNNELVTKKEGFKNLFLKINSLNEEINTTKKLVSNELNLIDEVNKKTLILKNKIEITKNNILTNQEAPYSVRNILKNPKLNTHGVIKSLIEVPKEYALAIDTSLSYSANFIVVDDFSVAKECINYLKKNNLGKATFFPLDTIKSRLIHESYSTLPGFIGIASNLISYDKKYKNIIENQLGNVLLVDTLDSLNTVAKETSFRHKVVSLDGGVVFPGGSIQGGSSPRVINYANDLQEFEKDLLTEEKNITLLNEKYNALLLLLQKKNENYEKMFREKNLLEIEIYELEKQRDLLKTEEININNFLSSLKDSVLSKEENYKLNLTEEVSTLEEEKNSLDKEIKSKEDEIIIIDKAMKDILLDINTINENNRIYEKNIKENEIRLKENEVKLDYMLNRLNEEFVITYEKASREYFLDIDESFATSKIESLKASIKKLGQINPMSIKEYEKLNERYTFLQSQSDDLNISINNLLKTISEMDQIMSEKFLTTFNLVNAEYQKLFKVMFNGGEGKLLLTEKDDLLNTGIEIVARPPGKVIDSTLSLSGGEKSLAAICLLFSILNVFPTPFVVLDEAEAALDEANIDLFGEYLNKKKELSQFVLITHKKRTMEYADVLYGITMQESGVSKVVSTKLT